MASGLVFNTIVSQVDSPTSKGFADLCIPCLYDIWTGGSADLLESFIVNALPLLLGALQTPTGYHGGFVVNVLPLLAEILLAYDAEDSAKIPVANLMATFIVNMPPLPLVILQTLSVVAAGLVDNVISNVLPLSPRILQK